MLTCSSPRDAECCPMIQREQTVHQKRGRHQTQSVRDRATLSEGNRSETLHGSNATRLTSYLDRKQNLSKCMVFSGFSRILSKCRVFSGFTKIWVNPNKIWVNLEYFQALTSNSSIKIIINSTLSPLLPEKIILSYSISFNPQ